MKLISLNLEGKRHLSAALPFLEHETPDCIALLEAPEDTQEWLQERGYHTTFAPMTHRIQDNLHFTDGVLFASKLPHTAEVFYYHNSRETIVRYEKDDKRGTIAHPVIFATVGNLQIASTHFTWNPVGETADENQTTDLQILLQYLKQKPSHILCGDFNIPRHHNKLYEVLLKEYTDAVPAEYKSSLDKTRHRIGADPELQKLFTDFMVDYVFTKAPYTATDVRLVFDVSDHAAVVATVA